LLSENSEHQGEYQSVGQLRGKRGLTRTEGTTRTWWEGQEETWAEGDKQEGGHQKISLRQHQLQGLRNEGVDKEEDQGVEKHKRRVGLVLLEGQRLPIGRQNETWGQGQEKSGGGRNFCGGNIWEHHTIYLCS